MKRFWDKVKKTDGCWLWTAHKDKNGYGRITINYKDHRAHRISYEIHNGPIAPTMLVCHSCDNPSCVNPNHLFLGTAQDNSSDMVKKRRCRFGTKNPAAKLTKQGVTEIRKLYRAGHSQKDIAKCFDVSDVLISMIVRHKIWK